MTISESSTMQNAPATIPSVTRSVTVPLGTRSYEIEIGRGLLSDAGMAIQELAPGARCAVVTDSQVAGLHLATVTESLSRAGVAFGEVVLKAGEAAKSFAELEVLCEALLDQELERGDVVVALGGGVIGDLAGFAASILKRGTRLVQIPTTLLAQVDSSVGGKTGINTRHGKNLIGSFHQPSLVIADIAILDTLDSRQFHAGYAEVAKYGLLGDAPFFAWLEEHWGDVFSGAGNARLYAVETSCRAKAVIVAEDEKEMGRRALLNLGHTFGHALEAWAGYSGRLLHGEAVAIGMVLAFEFSERTGLCPPGTSAKVAAHLRAVGLPTRIADIARDERGQGPTAQALMTLMAQDKKMKRGKLSLILVRGIGEAFVLSGVDPQDVEAFLAPRCAPGGGEVR
jgi:3-dehydroquinate synthase